MPEIINTTVEAPKPESPKTEVKKAPAKKPAAPVKKAPAKKAEAPAKKAPAKKAAPAKKEKAAKKGDAPAKPDYLRNPQIEILKALRKKNGTRKQLAEKLPNTVSMSEMLGSPDGEGNKYTKTLCEWGYVKGEIHDVDGRDTMVFSLTPKGKTALEKAEKEAS